MSRKIKIPGATILAALLVLAGCGGESASYDGPKEAAEPASVKLTPELEAKLASADRADGEEDHVVANCPGCNLAMEGEADNAVDVGDYALHFCSDTCQRDFSEDLQRSLVALLVPEEEAAEEAPQEETQP